MRFNISPCFQRGGHHVGRTSFSTMADLAGAPAVRVVMTGAAALAAKTRLPCFRSPRLLIELGGDQMPTSSRISS